jgi:hypothetical protein
VSAESMACFLFESDGTPLAPGICHCTASETVRDALAIVLVQPGRVITRCLLGDVRRVWVHLRDGVLLPAQVERIFFDPKRGRICALRVESAAGDVDSPPAVASVRAGG